MLTPILDAANWKGEAPAEPSLSGGPRLGKRLALRKAIALAPFD